MELEDDHHDGHCSQITCDPKCMTPQLLVRVVATEKDRNNNRIYIVHLSLLQSNLEWMIQRRYSDFDTLREQLEHFFRSVRVNQCFGCRWFSQSLRDFEFPRKRWLTSTRSYVIHERKSLLDRFSRLIATHTFSAIPKCLNCRLVPFQTIRDFFTTKAVIINHGTMDQILQALIAERFAPIMDPNKSKLEFRRGQGIWKVLQVEKPQQTRVKTSSRRTKKEEEEDKPHGRRVEERSEETNGAISLETSLRLVPLSKPILVSPRNESATWELTSPTRYTAAKQA